MKNYNKECMYLRKKIIEKPKVGKTTLEFKSIYICGLKKNYMSDNGCPPPKVCKGFKPSGIRVIR